MKDPSSPWVQTALGAIGVDMFFVLSGFVIALAAERAASAGTFLRQRIARVVPLYFLLTLPFIFAHNIQSFGNKRLLNSFLFLPVGEFGTFSGTLHPYGWTLCFEMGFYLFFAGLLLAPGRGQAARNLMLGLLVGVAANLLFYRGSWVLISFLFHPLTLEFAAGVALFRNRDWIVAQGWKLSVVLLPIFAAGAVQSDLLGDHVLVLADPHLGLARALLWGSFSVCVVALCLALDKSARVVWPRWLVLLGDASFSIYLIQPYVQRAVTALPSSSDAVRATAFLAITLIGGCCLWFLAERPLTGLARRWLCPDRTAAPQLTGKAGTAPA
jgi:exopolysaccharide production protein ExoZ